MRILPTVTLLLIVLNCAVPAQALDDALAFSGLTSVNAIYDVRTGDEKKLQFIFKVIRDTFDETKQQKVEPHYILTMRGPTVRLLVSGRHGDAELKKKTSGLIDELNKRGVRMEACGYALDLFALNEEDLFGGIHAIGNSLNSLIGYQSQGYALVSMN